MAEIKYESKIGQIPANDSTVFAVLSNLENINRFRDVIPQDKIKDMVSCLASVNHESITCSRGYDHCKNRCRYGNENRVTVRIEVLKIGCQHRLQIFKEISTGDQGPLCHINGLVGRSHHHPVKREDRDERQGTQENIF